MTAQHKLSCADIVPYAMENRLNEIQELWNVYCGWEKPTDEITEDSFHEYGLSFEYVDEGDDDNNYFRYLISTGGPSEESVSTVIRITLVSGYSQKLNSSIWIGLTVHQK